eukprot:991685_1
MSQFVNNNQNSNDSSITSASCYVPKEARPWNALKKFATKDLAHPVFAIAGTDKMLYCIDYSPPLTIDQMRANYHNDRANRQDGGIFEYDIKSDTHKTIVLWKTTNFQPSCCHSIYNPSQNEMIFVGGRDYYPKFHQHSFITIYNMTNNELRKKEIKIGIRIESGARLALTNNDTYLHIVGGRNNGCDLIVNLLTKQVQTKPNNIRPFRDDHHDYGVKEHELIYHKATNQLIIIGGYVWTSSSDKPDDCNHYFDFWTLDLNDTPNHTWKQHKKQKQVKWQQFTAVLYDNRVVIAFGGRKWEDYEDEDDMNEVGEANPVGIHTYLGGKLDGIYYMDLYGNAEWNKANIKCPKPGKHNVVIANNIVHLMPWGDYNDHFYIKISDLLPVELVNKNIQIEMKQDIQSNDDDKEEEQEELKNELIALMNKMNGFNKKYDEKELSKIFKCNPYSLFVEQEIENTEAICKATLKHLQDIKKYVVSVTKPDVNTYKSWDLNTTMVWIRSLDDGCFVKYCDALQKGFESDGIEAVDLPNLGQADLATDPFNIRAFRDRKKISQHFQSLEQKAAVMDGPDVTAYI